MSQTQLRVFIRRIGAWGDGAAHHPTWDDPFVAVAVDVHTTVEAACLQALARWHGGLLTQFDAFVGTKHGLVEAWVAVPSGAHACEAARPLLRRSLVMLERAPRGTPVEAVEAAHAHLTAYVRTALGMDEGPREREAAAVARRALAHVRDANADRIASERQYAELQRLLHSHKAEDARMVALQTARMDAARRGRDCEQ